MTRDESDDLTHGCITADELGHGLGQARRRGWHRTIRGGADPPGELITTACDRANQITVYAERLAKRGDVGLEVVFFDDPVRPDPSHQLILVDDPATAVDQDEQRVEGATPDRDRCPAGNELAAMGYDLEATEFQGR